MIKKKYHILRVTPINRLTWFYPCFSRRLFFLCQMTNHVSACTSASLLIGTAFSVAWVQSEKKCQCVWRWILLNYFIPSFAPVL